MTPEFHFDFASQGQGKVRVGEEFTSLLNPQIDVNGFQQLDVSATAGRLEIGPWTLQIMDDDEMSEPPGLSGSIDVEDGTAQFAIRQFESAVENGIAFRGELATIAYGEGLAPETPLLSATEIELDVSLPGLQGVRLDASDLQITHDGNASITSAGATLDPNSHLSSLGGFLPLRLTEVLIDARDEDGDGNSDPISLENLDADVTVRGFLDDSLLASLPFTPIVGIGDQYDPVPNGSSIDLTYRSVDGVLSPWNVGPIRLEMQNVDVGGYSAEGVVTLGGYRRGRWVESLTGYLEIENSGNNGDFAGLRFDIVPEHSSLRLPGSILDDGAMLKLRGEVQLDDGFTGQLGGVTLAGATLSFDASIEATPTASQPPLAYSASFDLREVVLGEITIDAGGLGTLIAKEIRIEPDPAPGESIASIGVIEFRAASGSLFREMETLRVEVAGADLYSDRLELGDVTIVLDGAASVSGVGSDLPDPMLLFEEFEIELAGLSLSGNFSDLADLPQGLSLSSATDAINVRGKSAILMPQSLDPTTVPKLQFDADGQLIGELPAEVDGLAIVAGISGTVDPASGSLSLSAEHFSATVFEGARVSGENASINLDPDAAADDVVMSLNPASLRITTAPGQDAELQVVDLRVKRNGEVSIEQATATLPSPATLGFAGILPLEVTRLRIADDPDGDGNVDSRTVLNRLNNDGTIASDVNIEVQGAFDFSPLDAVGLSADVSIGGVARTEGDSFTSSFRLVDGRLVPWTTGDIAIELAGTSDIGLDFVASLDSDGYTAGVWDPDITGTMTGSLQVDGGSVLSGSDLMIEILPGSKLHLLDHGAALSLDIAVKGGFGVNASFGGINLRNAELRVALALETTTGPTAPFFEVSHYDVRAGELAVSELTLDAAGFGTVTLREIVVDPNAGPDDPIATFRRLGVDLSDHPTLSELESGQASGLGGKIYRDAIKLDQATINMDGVITDGAGSDPVALMLVDDLKLRFNQLEISGHFAPESLGQTLPISAEVLGIEFDLAAAILLPDALASLNDVTDPCVDSDAAIQGVGAVCDVSGRYDANSGDIAWSAERMVARPVAGVQLEASNVELAPGVAGAPLLSADEAAVRLGIVDSRTVTLVASGIRVEPDGELSIASAELASSGQGVLTTLGFGGVLPLDVTHVALAALPGSDPSRVVLNRDANRDGLPDSDFVVNVGGTFDFSALEFVGIDLDVSIGNPPVAEGGFYQTQFRFVDGVARPWETGPIVVSIAAGPYTGISFDGDLTLGGYRAGQWDPSLTGNLNVLLERGDASALSSAAGDFGVEILPGSRLDFDADEARLLVDGQLQFSGEGLGSFGGLSLDNATLDFAIGLDANLSVRSPFIEFRPIEVTVGVLAIDEIEVRLENLAVITLTDIEIDVAALTASEFVGTEYLGRIHRAEIDLTESPAFSELNVGRIDVVDARLFRDRIVLADIRVPLDGIITDGNASDPTPLVYIEDLLLHFDDVTISGGFDPNAPAGIVDVNGRVDGIRFSTDVAVLMPDEQTNLFELVDPCAEGVDAVTGLAVVCGVVGSYDGSSGEVKLEADRAAARLLPGLTVGSRDLTLNLGGDDPGVPIASGSGTLTLQVGTQSPVQLNVTDLQLGRNGELSMQSADLTAGGGVLTSMGFGGIVPLDITSLTLAAADIDEDGVPDARTILNRDANQDGLPDGDFDVGVKGFFNFAPLAELGVDLSVTIGGATFSGQSENQFDLDFRLVDGALQPWNSGPIEFRINAASDVGLNFDATLTSAGYTAGVWDPMISGSMTGSLEIDETTVGTGDGEITFNILPTSRLDFDQDSAHLAIDGEVHFLGQIERSFAGLNVTGGMLDFNVFVDARLHDQPPVVESQRFDVVIGELQIDQLAIEIDNLGTLTLEQLLVDPTAGIDDPIAVVRDARFDFRDHPSLSQLNLGEVTVAGTAIYRDRIEIGNIDVSLSGLITDGAGADPQSLFWVDDLLLSIDDLKIDGLFSPDALFGTINVGGTLNEIRFSTDAALLVPDGDVTFADVVRLRNRQELSGALAGVLNVVGSYDGATGDLNFKARRLIAEPLPGVNATATDVDLNLGDSGMPLLQVSLASLGVTLIDDRSVQLDVHNLVIDRGGEISIDSALLEAERGVMASLGFGGIMPLDLTRIEVQPVGGSSGTPIVLNQDLDGDGLPDGEIKFVVDGVFDFSALQAYGIDLDVTIGSPLYELYEDENSFSTEFRLVDGVVTPWETGEIAANLSAGPYSGLTFASQLTLGGYVGGVWDPRVSGSMTGSLLDDAGDDVAASAQVTFTVDPASRLFLEQSGARLEIDGAIEIDGAAASTYGGISIENATLDVSIFLDSRITASHPFVEFTRFDVEIGELSIEEIVVEVTNLGTLTLSNIVIDRQAGPNEAIAEVESIDLDVSQIPWFSELTLADVDVRDAKLYRDRIEFADVEFSFDGAITDGDLGTPTELLLVEDFSLVFSEVSIATPLNDIDHLAANSPISFNGSLSGITVDSTGVVLLPDAGVSNLDVDALCADRSSSVPGIALACGIDGTYSNVDGSFSLFADRVAAHVMDGLVMESSGVQLAVNDSDPVQPLASADEARLIFSLVDPAKPVVLAADEPQLAADGEISVAFAELSAPSGVLDSIGLAGLIPFDVTRLRLGDLEGDRTVLNRDADQNGLPDGDFEILVEGEFDFSMFLPAGMEVTATIGADGNGPGVTYSAEGNSAFQAEFRIVDGVLTPWNVGPIEMGLSGQPLDGISLSGDLRLGGYHDGVWVDEIDGRLSGEISTELTGGSVAAEFDLLVDEQTSLFDFDQARLELLGTAEFDANANFGTFGGISLSDASLDFSLIADVGTMPNAPYLTLEKFSFGIGDSITIDNFSVNLAEVLLVTASGIEIFTQRREDGQIGSVDHLTLDLLGFGLSSGVDVVGVKLYEDRLVIPSVEFRFDGTLSVEGFDLLQVADLRVDFGGVQIDGFDLETMQSGDIALLENFQLTDGDISLSLGNATILPGSSLVTGGVYGLSGHFVFDENNDQGLPVGALDIAIDSADASIADGLFSATIGPSRLTLGVGVSRMLDVSSATLSTNLFGDTSIELAANGLRIDRDGLVSITSASIGARSSEGDRAAGIGETLGLAQGLLPLDVSYVGIENPGQRIALNLANPGVSLTSIDDLLIEVEGYFDFALFDPLPFDPYVQIGGTRAEDSQTTFDLAFSVKGLESGAPEIEITNTGTIVFGIFDYELGPLSLDETLITLGGFNNGQWSPNFGFDVQLSWDDAGGLPIDFRFGTSGDGKLLGPDQDDNPSPGATRFELDLELHASLGAGNLELVGGSGANEREFELELDPASSQNWGFGFEELAINLEVFFAVTADPETGVISIDPVASDTPFLKFEGIEAEQIAMNLAGRMWMSAEEVSIDFDAFESNTQQGDPVPFLAFGGQESDGGLTLQFGDFEGGNDPDNPPSNGTGLSTNPLSGLGGSAGNFGIAWNGGNPLVGEIPFELVQFENMFFEITLPQNGGFGLGALIPVRVEKIGVRFPQTFGDIFGQTPLPEIAPLPETAPLPANVTGGEGPSAISVDDVIEIGRQGLDALSNFTLVFSGNADVGLGMAAISGDVEDVEVHVGLLYEYAKEILHQFGLADPLVDMATELVPNPGYFEAWIDDPLNPPSIDELDISVSELVQSSGNVLAAIEAIGPRLMILFPDLLEDFVDETANGFQNFPVRFDTISFGASVGIGPLTVGGTLAVSIIDDVPVKDPETDEVAIETVVWLVTVEGNVRFGEYGGGATLQFTQFGPVGFGFNVDVPLPVGMIAGALAGSVVPGLGTGVGAAIGKKSGFIMEDFHGILYFEKDLPNITAPTDILESDFADPLNNDPAARERVANLLRFEDGRVHYDQPWREGFRLIADGFLTNKYVKGLFGARVTLGANVNFGGFFSEREAAPSVYDAGVQLYALASLEIADGNFLSGQLSEAGILFNFQDPLNPEILAAAKGNTGDSLLALLFPIDATMEMTWDFDRVLPGMVAAIDVLVDAGLGGFADLLDLVAEDLNNNRQLLLAQALLDVDGDNRVSDAENDAVGVIDRSFIVGRLGEIFTLMDGPDEFTADQWDEDGVLSSSVQVGPGFAQSLNRAALVAQELVYQMTVSAIRYDGNRDGIPDGIDVLGKLLDELNDAGREAYDLFFDIINPSFTFSGAVQPVLLGMPIGEPRESVKVYIDKEGISFDGKFRVLEKLMAISPLPIPLYDEINVSVVAPFENLFKDLAVNRLPEIDLARGWRATFVGTLRLFDVIDLGDVSGIFFPAAPVLEPGESLPPNTDDDGDGIPNDHPLETHVQVFATQPDRSDVGSSSVDTALFGFDEEAGEPLTVDKIVVLEEHLPTLREHGGVLLDARMTLPEMITDPAGWFHRLQGLAAEAVTRINEDEELEIIPACQAFLDDPINSGAAPSALNCFLANIPGFLASFLELPGAILAEETVAQTQLFVPNFTDELIDAFDLDNPSGAFDTLRQALVGKPHSNDPNESTAPDLSLLSQFDIRPTIDKIVDHSYFYGEVGNVPGGPETADTLFGIAIDGARIEYADPDADTSPNERRFRVIPNFKGLQGQFEFSGVAAEDVSAAGSLPPFQTITLPTFPAFGGSLSVGSAGNAESEIETLLEQFGISDAAAWLPGGDLASLGSDVAAATFEFYTPGFSTDESDPLIRRNGGIGANFDLSILNFIDAQFDFEVSPSQSGALIPDFIATGAVDEFTLIPGTKPESLRLGLDHRDAQLTATLSGGIELFGYKFNIPQAVSATMSTGGGPVPSLIGPQSATPPVGAAASLPFEIHPDGFSGRVGLSVEGFGVKDLFSVDGSFALEFDTRVPSARIVADGTGTIGGIEVANVRGSFGSDGCFAMTAPFVFDFELPGGNCQTVPDKPTLVLSMPESIALEEGSDSSGGWREVSFTVTAAVINPSSDFTVIVPWLLTHDSTESGDVRYIPTQDVKERELFFKEETNSHTIKLEIREDVDFERPEEFVLQFGQQTIEAGSNVDIQIARDETIVRILNDDEPEFGFAPPLPKTVVYFDFDDPVVRGGYRGEPDYTADSSDTLATINADKFHPTQVVNPKGLRPKAGPGLPVAIDQEDVIVTTALSNAIAFPDFNPELLTPPALEFTIEPRDKSWMIQGIQFYSYRPRGAKQDWQLRWSLDDFSEPIFESDSQVLDLQPFGDDRVWTVHQHQNIPGPLNPNPDIGSIEVHGHRAISEPVTFRLVNTSGDVETPWYVDNLSIAGVYGDAIRIDLKDIDPEFNDRHPGDYFESLGLGDLFVVSRDPGTIDPLRGGLDIVAGNSDPLISEIILGNNGTPTNPDSFPTSIIADGGLSKLGFEYLGDFVSTVTIGGKVRAVDSKGADWSGLFEATAVEVIRSLVDAKTGIGGNLSADLELDSVGRIEVVGGDLSSSISTMDLAHMEMDVSVRSLGGKGGKLNSPNSFHIAGGIQRIVANEINLRVEAGGSIDLIRAVDDGPDRPARLEGRLTAHRFGTIEVDENGSADFVLTATATAEELGGAPAFDEIRIPEGAQYVINLQPGVQPGAIIVIRDSDGDGISDDTEDRAAGGGDGNNDGIPDRQQPHVTSVPTPDGNLMTVVVDEGLRLYAPVRWDEFAESPTDTTFFDGFFTLYVTAADGSVLDAPVDVEYLLDGGTDLTSLYVAAANAFGFVDEIESYRQDADDGTGVRSLAARRVLTRHSDGGRGDFDADKDSRITILAGFGLATDRPAQNPIDPFDVNNDGLATPFDALEIINIIARNQASGETSYPAGSRQFYDVNDDSQVTPLDALQVINAIAQRQAAGEFLAERTERIDSALAIASQHTEKTIAKRPDRSLEFRLRSPTRVGQSDQPVDDRDVDIASNHDLTVDLVFADEDSSLDSDLFGGINAELDAELSP